jgi:hypothetical protein
MSILSKIFNAVTPSVPASPTTTSVPLTFRQGYSAAAHVESLDDFEKKFSARPYFDGGTWRLHEFLTAHRPQVPKKMVVLILKKSGNLFSEDDRASLKSLYDQQQAIHERMGELGFYAATKIWQQEQAELMPKIIAGEKVICRTKEQILSDITQQRRVLHDAMRPLSESVYQILAPACDRLKEVARQLTIEQEKDERGTHDLLDGGENHFAPSQYLKTLAFVALVVCDRPILNFQFTRLLSAPNPDKPLIEMWFPSADAVPARVPQPAALHPIEQERRRQEAEAAAAAHRVALAEKNAMVERVQKAALGIQEQIAQNISPKASASGAAEIIAGGTPPQP